MKRIAYICLALIALNGCLSEPENGRDALTGNPFIGQWVSSGGDGSYLVRDSLFRMKMDSAFAPVEFDSTTEFNDQLDSITKIWDSVEEHFSCTKPVCDSALRPYTDRWIFADSSAIHLTFKLMWERPDSPRIPTVDTLKLYRATTDTLYGESRQRILPSMPYYGTVIYALPYHISKARDSLIFYPEWGLPTIYLKKF